jgi:hypothetical protein
LATKSRSVHQPLADDVLNRFLGGLSVGYVSRIITEIELTQITGKVLSAVVVECSDDALHDGEEPFEGVGVNALAILMP